MSGNRIGEAYYGILRAVRALLLDVVVPGMGLYVVFQLAQGRFDPAALPIVIPFASGMLGIPFLRRLDERRRESEGPGDGSEERARRRRKRRVTIDWGGDDDGDSPSA